MKQRQIVLSAFCIFLVFYMTNGAFAQADTAIFAPFVSHLQAKTSGDTVTLSWIDSQSVKGPVYIYRSSRTFENMTWPENQFAEVYYGRQTYTEKIPAHGLWYYLVVASDESQQKYEMIIPYNNILELPVDGSDRIVQASAFSPPFDMPSANLKKPLPSLSGRYAYTDRTPVTTPQALPATLMLTGLSAVTEGNGIKVSFVSANPAKNAVVYRNITPIMRISDLLSSDIAQLPGAKSPFVDQVKSGTPYYYAVVYDEDIRSGEAYIAPGYNATMYPAAAVYQALPEYPYPVETTISPPVTTLPLAASSKLSVEAAAALSSGNWKAPIPYQTQSTPIIVQKTITTPPDIVNVVQSGIEPRVFNQDLLTAPVGSDEQRLQKIVKESFTWRNWNKAAAELRQLLATVQNAPVEARARFYLGQTFYFTGAFNNAMTEFLAVQSRYPNETTLWIQLTLSALSGVR